MARIALVSTSYPSDRDDPSGHFVRAEALALARAGHHVLVVTTGRTRPSSSREPAEHPLLELVRLDSGEAAGWPGISARLARNPLRALALAAWLARARRTLLERGPFDRLIAHWLLPSAFPLATSLRHRGELEVVAHGSDSRLLARLPARLRGAVARALARHHVSYRCSSHEVAGRVEAALGLGAGTAEVVPPLLELGPVPARSRARRELGLEPDARIALVVGRLVPGKRVRTALSALRLLDVESVVVGDGPELASLRAEHPEARFLGRLPRPESLRWIAAADALVSASLDEGAPTAIREARALGVPVAARPAGDVARWALDDEGLVLVP